MELLLNTEQEEAVSHLYGPCLVTAVPGSGKTRVLTMRVMRLIQQHRIFPQHILCLTFTNKAANEMRDRLATSLSEIISDQLWISTFHSLCLSILRKYSKFVELKPGFSVYDEKDQIDLIRKIARMHEYECQQWVIKDIARVINDVRENLDKFQTAVRGLGIGYKRIPKTELAIAQEYLTTLDDFNAVDFSGILYKTWCLFRRKPEVSKTLSERFKFVSVDEGQDTNVIQYEIVKQIAQHGNLFVVGDYDQCVRAGEYICVGPNDEIRPVETLNVGDHVLTCSGSGHLITKPIVAKKEFTDEVMETSLRVDDKKWGQCLKVTSNHQMFVLRGFRWNKQNVKSVSNGMSITLVGDYRNQSHRFSIWCADDNLTNTLERELGLKFRVSASDVRYVQRCDSTRTSMTDILKIKEQFIEIADRLGVKFWFREKAKIMKGRSFDVVDASSIVPGDYVPKVKIIDSKMTIALSEVVDVFTGLSTATYYDFEIQDTHNFISEGIIHSNSIFSWRGACPENLNKIKKDFDNVHNITLPRNYRSTAKILTTAQQLIRHNDNAKNTCLCAERGDGESPHLFACGDPDHEARVVVSRILSCQRTGLNWSDFAVIYRTNQQSKFPEMAMRQHDIPYRILGGFSFFDRREIKDTLAYLSLIANPYDTISFARAISEPKRKVGDTLIGKLERMCQTDGICILEAAKRVDSLNGVTAAAKRNLLEFVHIVEGYQQRAQDGESIEHLASGFIKDTGYYDHMTDQSNKDDVSRRRIDNVDELLLSVADFAAGRKNAKMGDYLQSIKIFTEHAKNSGDCVTLMTMHSAKGSEYRVIFIIGAEKDIIPHSLALRDHKKAAEEEERRLMYVAATRAQDRLFVSFCKNRPIFRNGVFRHRNSFPSPFLSEMFGDFDQERV